MKRLIVNRLLLSDSYKVSHYKQYPPNTTNIYSYLESRGGKFKKTVFFGLQYLLKKYFCNPITMHELNHAKIFYKNHLGSDAIFNEDGWRYIIEKLHGYLPLRICAVEEGQINTVGTPLMTVENTDPNCYWLTNYFESLLMQVWYPITVATQSYAIKQLLQDFNEQTSDDKNIDFKLHDFGFRGVSSVESAGIGGMAHLLNFQGTDTAIALDFIDEYYRCSKHSNNLTYGFSIPAAEHSTITSWGKDREEQAYRNMVDAYGSGAHGAYAVVSDSYDIYNAVANIWGDKLKEQVLKADNTLVIRPDSGNPMEVILKLLVILEEKFGVEVNSKGYKVLNPKVRLIQGDGVDYDSIRLILSYMRDYKYSVDNIAFGMGGALLQKLDRDTQKFAFKCSSACVDGKEIPVFKDPITDTGKRSKQGRFDKETYGSSGYLGLVYEDGILHRECDFNAIRKKITQYPWEF